MVLGSDFVIFSPLMVLDRGESLGEKRYEQLLQTSATSHMYRSYSFRRLYRLALNHDPVPVAMSIRGHHVLAVCFSCRKVHVHRRSCPVSLFLLLLYLIL